MNKKPYGTNGRMIFDRLWKALEIRGKNKQYLKDNGIHSNTVAKLTKNENVSCEVLVNICKLLDASVFDI
jgi:DNA-binding Xre family transcriptional regulator